MLSSGNSPASEFYMPTFWDTLFDVQRQIGMKILHTYPPMKIENTVCSETSAYKIQTPENYPEESIQHSDPGKSLKSRNHVGVDGIHIAWWCAWSHWTNIVHSPAPHLTEFRTPDQLPILLLFFV